MDAGSYIVRSAFIEETDSCQRIHDTGTVLPICAFIHRYAIEGLGNTIFSIGPIPRFVFFMLNIEANFFTDKPIGKEASP